MSQRRTTVPPTRAHSRSSRSGRKGLIATEKTKKQSARRRPALDNRFHRTLRSSRPRAVRWPGASAPRASWIPVSVWSAREGTRRLSERTFYESDCQGRFSSLLIAFLVFPLQSAPSVPMGRIASARGWAEQSYAADSSSMLSRGPALRRCKRVGDHHEGVDHGSIRDSRHCWRAYRFFWSSGGDYG